MPTQKTSGTQSATVTTEHTLATITDAGTYILVVDCNALDDGDELELRAKVKTLSGGTTRLAYTATYIHAQEELVKISVPIPCLHELVFTLEQAAGTGRSFPWEVVEL